MTSAGDTWEDPVSDHNGVSEAWKRTVTMDIMWPFELPMV